MSQPAEVERLSDPAVCELCRKIVFLFGKQLELERTESGHLIWPGQPPAPPKAKGREKA
jgi:hypothetical protein